MAKVPNILKFLQDKRAAWLLERAIQNHSLQNVDPETAKVVSLLEAIPESEKLPTYTKRHRFVTVQQETPVQTKSEVFIRSVELGFATAGLLLLVTMVASSQPGEALHPYKSTARNFKVVLSPSPQDRAEAAVQIAQQNFSAVQKIIDKPSSTTEEKKAAVAEVAKQTKAAIERVSEVAKQTDANPEEKKANEQLAMRLASLASDQLELAKAVSKSPEIDEEAKKTLISQAESIVEKATQVEEEVLAVKEQPDDSEVGGINEEEAIMIASPKENTDSEKTKEEVKSETDAVSPENPSEETIKQENKPSPKPGTNSGKVPDSQDKKDDTIDIVDPKPANFQGGFIPEPPNSETESF